MRYISTRERQALLEALLRWRDICNRPAEQRARQYRRHLGIVGAPIHAPV